MGEICFLDGGAFGWLGDILFGENFLCIEGYVLAGILLIIVGLALVLLKGFLGEDMPDTITKLGMISLALGIFLSVIMWLIKDIWLSSIYLRIAVYFVAFIILLNVVLFDKRLFRKK